MRAFHFVGRSGRQLGGHLQRNFAATVGPLGATVGKSWYLWPAGIAALTGATMHGTSKRGEEAEAKGLVAEPCVQRLMQREGVKVVPAAGAMLRRHGIAGRLIAQDYWVRITQQLYGTSTPSAAGWHRRRRTL